MWIGFIWFNMRCTSRLFWARCWAFGLHKRRRISLTSKVIINFRKKTRHHEFIDSAKDYSATKLIHSRLSLILASTLALKCLRFSKAQAVNYFLPVCSCFRNQTLRASLCLYAARPLLVIDCTYDKHKRRQSFNKFHCLEEKWVMLSRGLRFEGRWRW
jgi:hypothetical protein